MTKIQVSFDGIEEGRRPRHPLHELEHAADAMRLCLPGVTPDTPPFHAEIHREEPAFVIVLVPAEVPASQVDVMVNNYREICADHGFEVRLQRA